MSSTHNNPYFEKAGNIFSTRSVTPAALGALAAAIYLDRHKAAHDKRRSSAEVEMFDDGVASDETIITLPGCRTDGMLAAEMLRPTFQTLGSTVFTAYPQREFTIDAVKSKLLETRLRRPDAKISFYAISMGGLVLSHLLQDQEFTSTFGYIDKIIVDSSPSEIGDVRPASRLALGYAKVFSDSWAMGRVANTYMSHRSKAHLEHEPCVSDDQVRRHARASATAPLYQTQSQGNFIQSSPLRTSTLKGNVGSAYYLHSMYDSVIDTQAAYESYNTFFNGTMIDVTDRSRPHGSHAAGMEYQSTLMELMHPTSSAVIDERSLSVSA